MNKPMMCRSCNRLMGVAEECPWCGASRPNRAQAFFYQFKKSRSLSSTDIIVRLTIAAFILELFVGLLFGGVGIVFKSLLSVPGGILELLGASSPRVFQGEWWGLFTATWLHGGALHLLFNVMALRQIGELIEQMTTSSFTWIAYILTGVGGFLLSAAAGHFSVGASASIFGLIGLGISIAFLLGDGTRDPMFKALISWAAMGLLFGFLFPAIDNTAHLGGLITGGGLGLLWSAIRQKRLIINFLPKLAVALCALTVIGLVYSILNKLQIV